MSREQNLENIDIEKLVDVAESAMFVADYGSDIKLCFANKTFYDMLKYKEEDFDSHFANQLMDVIVPEEKQKVRNLIARQAAAGGKLQLEFRVMRGDERIIWVSMTATTIQVGSRRLYYCSCMDITQNKRSLEDIYNAKREMDLITNNVPGGVIKLRMSDYKILYANDGFYRLSGYSRTEYFSMFGNYCNRVIHPEDLNNVQKLIQTAVENRGPLGFEYRIMTKKGEIHWSYVNGTRVDDQDGEPVYFCIIVDITARKELEVKYKDAIIRSKYLLKYMKESEWTYNIADEKMLMNGYIGEYKNNISKDGIEYVPMDFVRSMIHPADMPKIKNVFDERKEYLGQEDVMCRVKDHKGDYCPCEITMISVDLVGNGKPDRIYGEARMIDDATYKNEGGNGLDDKELSGEDAADIVMQKFNREQRERKDAITGTMPYNKFLLQAQKVMDKREEDDKYAILCCDINGYQTLIYHYGISCATEALEILAGAVSEQFEKSAICSRIKGDYFVYLLKVEDPSEISKKMSKLMVDIKEKTEKLNFLFSGTTHGLYVLRAEDNDIHSVMRKADLARRSIKGTTGNRYANYTDEIETEIFYEDEMIRDIGNAMRNHAVEICYLPRILEDKNNIIGCKATPTVLLANGKYLPMDDLRKYMDRNNEVQQMVYYVLNSVCTNQGVWKNSGKKIMPISIDITPGQLCMKDAVDKINHIVKSNHLDPFDIIFEIQEQYFKNVSDEFRVALIKLNSYGYRIVISRFGSDHISIKSLRNLPIYAIKFHGEFFHESINNEREQIIYKNIVGLAWDLGIKTSCGGIHTKLQEEYAKKIGCNIFEGEMYYGAVRSDVYEKCFLSE